MVDLGNIRNILPCRPKVLYNVKNSKFGGVNVKQTQIKVSRTDVLLEISFDVSRNYLQSFQLLFERIGFDGGRMKIEMMNLMVKQSAHCTQLKDCLQ